MREILCCLGVGLGECPGLLGLFGFEGGQGIVMELRMVGYRPNGTADVFYKKNIQVNRMAVVGVGLPLKSPCGSTNAILI